MPLFRALLLLLGVSLLVACKSDEPVFKVGINRWLGYEPLYLAQHLGFYPDVQIVRLSSTLDVMRALRNGNLQAAGLTLDETLMLIDEGIELDIVLVLDYSNGADMVTAAPDIQSLQDLKGKRIGVEMNASGAIMLHGLLSKAGLTIDEVKVASMPVSHLAEAYANQRIDAAVSYQPKSSELMALGMHPIFSSADIPGQIVDVLVVRSDSLDRDQAIRQLIAGYFRTHQFMQEHPEAALQRMASDLGSNITDLQQDMKGIQWLSYEESRKLLLQGDDLLETAGRMGAMMRDLGMIKNETRPADIVDTRWLEGVTQ